MYYCLNVLSKLYTVHTADFVLQQFGDYYSTCASQVLEFNTRVHVLGLVCTCSLWTLYPVSAVSIL